MTMMGKKALIYSRRLTVLAAATGMLMISGAGCGSSELETGYKPRLLSSSDAQRRAYYAPQYSREAAMAAQQQQGGADSSSMAKHRPGAPY